MVALDPRFPGTLAEHYLGRRLLGPIAGFQALDLLLMRRNPDSHVLVDQSLTREGVTSFDILLAQAYRRTAAHRTFTHLDHATAAASLATARQRHTQSRLRYGLL
jgi:hypothetical protein